jgi:hypothetical protein
MSFFDGVLLAAGLGMIVYIARLVWGGGRRDLRSSTKSRRGGKVLKFRTSSNVRRAEKRSDSAGR